MTLPADIRRWPLRWREDYEERAAIMEYMGDSVPRHIAECEAELRVREREAATPPASGGTPGSPVDSRASGTS